MDEAVVVASVAVAAVVPLPTLDNGISNNQGATMAPKNNLDQGSDADTDDDVGGAEPWPSYSDPVIITRDGDSRHAVAILVVALLWANAKRRILSEILEYFFCLKAI